MIFLGLRVGYSCLVMSRVVNQTQTVIPRGHRKNEKIAPNRNCYFTSAKALFSSSAQEAQHKCQALATKSPPGFFLEAPITGFRQFTDTCPPSREPGECSARRCSTVLHSTHVLLLERMDISFSACTFVTLLAEVRNQATLPLYSGTVCVARFYAQACTHRCHS